MNLKEKQAINWLVTVLSSVSAIALGLVHILWSPADDNRLGVLVIDMIPSAIVVLLAFPTAYFLLIRKSIRISQLPNPDSELDSEDPRALLKLKLDSEPDSTREKAEELDNSAWKAYRNSNVKHRDIFVVVNMQRDFFMEGALPIPGAESLLRPINNSIEAAEHAGAIIIFTQDWHPPDHMSFRDIGTVRPAHCVQGTMGAKFHSDLVEPKDFEVIKFGSDAVLPGLSPFENSRMRDIIDDINVREVIVAGLSMEYCVLATCIGVLRLKKSVCVIENLVRATNPEKLKEVWREFDKCRIRHVDDFSWA